MFNDHPRSRDHRPLNAHPRAFEQLQKRLRECKQANVDLAREISKVGVRIFLLVLNRISHVRTIYDVYFESLPFSLSFSLTQIRGESKDARDLANRASLSESMMRVAHNCERAEFARLRREDSKKMKQMRDEILRLKIALSHVTNDAKMTTTTTEKEEKDAVEQHFLAPAGASISSSSPPASSHVRLNQDDIAPPRRRVEGEFADTKEYFESFSSDEEEDEEEISSSWSDSDEEQFAIVSKGKRVGLKKRDENKEKRPLLPLSGGKKDDAVTTTKKTTTTQKKSAAIAQPETDDENDRAQLLVLGRKGGGKPPIPPTSKKLQKKKKKKKKNVKDEHQHQQKRPGQSLAARMGFTATVVGSAISSVTERRSSRDVDRVKSYKEPSLLTKMRRP